MIRYLAASVALCLTTPAMAQEALTPEEDLQCALLTAAGVALSKDAEANTGGAAIVSYFFGRYEGRTGKKFDEADIAATTKTLMENAAELAPKCQAAALSLGTRMQSWSKSLQSKK